MFLGRAYLIKEFIFENAHGNQLLQATQGTPFPGLPDGLLEVIV
jgi:hypothetical protein